MNIDFKDIANFLNTHVGLVLTVAVPIATHMIQKSMADLEPEIKPRGISFHKSESFMEVRKGEDSSASSEHTFVSFGLEQPLVIAMVGLPARGKSYIVNMIIRYLKWIGFEAKVFNVGSYRRKMGLQSADSNFFDANNEEGKRVREEMAMAVQDSMYEWLHSSKDFKRRVAIFDATNTTIKRRLSLAQRAREHKVDLLFVESICNDQEVLRQNYNLKLQNEDYKGMDPEQARKDFMDRVHAYEKVYETIEDFEDGHNISYLKLVNVGQKVITRNCHGYLPSQVAFYLQNVHIFPRKIFLSVNAEAINVSDLVGGMQSGTLTAAGSEYAQSLADYLEYAQQSVLVERGREILVLTGTTNLHSESTEALRGKGYRVYPTPVLNELRGGDFHGLTKEQFKTRHPIEYAKRLADKLNYRYPGAAGESYLDVIERVRPVIIELERQRRSIVLVCHLAVLRCIYAYFMGIPVGDLPHKDLRTHHIYELSPGPFGCHCSVIDPRAQVPETLYGLKRHGKQEASAQRGGSVPLHICSL